jgi:uncharacterized protein YfiM (DUF2279 family)
MTASSQTELDPRGAEVRDLAWDLACCSGALSEIATCWRRSQSLLPDLPPGLPLQLQDSARRMGADARSLAGAGPGAVPGPAADLAQRFAAFRQDFACARDMTRHAWTSRHAGDALLWDSADAALNSAGNHVRLIIEQGRVTD